MKRSARQGLWSIQRRRRIAACLYGTIRRAAGAFLPLLAAVPLAAQGWDAPEVSALVDRAVAHRAQRDTALKAYTAQAHGTLLFLGDLGASLLGGPRVVKAEELATRLTWRAPGYTDQRIVGRRDTLLLPGDVGFYRDRYGVITNNLGDRIRLGDARDVRDLPHPLSPEGRANHEFALADSLALSLPGHRVDVYVLDVRPGDASVAGGVGTIVLERETGAVVRMALTFTPAAMLDQRIERLTLILENVLVEGRFWLPFRQELEVVRGGTWLDFPVKGVVRARWDVCCHAVVADPQAVPSMAGGGSVLTSAAGNRVIMAPPSERAEYPWETPLVDVLEPSLNLASEQEAFEVRKRAEQLVAQRLEARTTRTALSARSVSDILHVNRVEGLALGAGFTLRLAPRWSVALRAGYGFSDDEAKGDLTLAYRPSATTVIEAFGGRRYRDAGDIAEVSGVRNTIAAQGFGEDATDPYDVRGGGARVRVALSAATNLQLGLTRERQEPVSVNAEPWSGAYLPTIDATALDATRGALALTGRGWAGPWGSTLGSQIELRVARLDPRDDAAASTTVARIAAAGTFETSLGGSSSLFVEAGGGYVDGGDVPAQELVRFGGIVSGPGYDYHRFATRLGGRLRIEPRIRVPFLRLPLIVYEEQSPPWATLAPYGHIVCVKGGEPDRFGAASGCYPAVGLGFSMLYDVIRFDVAKGLRDGEWTFGVDAARMFWGLL